MKLEMKQELKTGEETKLGSERPGWKTLEWKNKNKSSSMGNIPSSLLDDLSEGTNCKCCGGANGRNAQTGTGY